MIILSKRFKVSTNGDDSLVKSVFDDKYRVMVKVKTGTNVKIMPFVNLYECEIGDNSFIGPFVEIQRGVKIGENVRIQSHSFLCTGVTIEDNVFIGHGVMFVNDL